jgi:mannose-6-phosphate isomerase
MRVFDTIWRLQPDNFTPPQRTPWGGQKILSRYKRGLSISADKAAYACVGESWEISVEPSFPSRLIDHDNITLAEAIARDPKAALGAAAGKGGLSILVKLLDAKDALSVQVHPTDAYAGLSPKQSGKPESWIILEAEPGAGLYLGFRDGVSRDDVERALTAHTRLDTLMNFVAVKPGDVFEIEAGTAHAIGPGVTLIEPQLVQPGKEGVTYRFWDWNRKYDAQGRPSEQGAPRALHVKESLEVTRFDLLGEAFVESTRRPGKQIAPHWRRHIDNPAYCADVLSGTGEVTLSADTGVAIVVARGSVRTPHGTLTAGASAFIPASVAASLKLSLSECFASLSAAR